MIDTPSLRLPGTIPDLARKRPADRPGAWQSMGGWIGEAQEALRCWASHALRSLRRSSSEVPPQMPDS